MCHGAALLAVRNASITANMSILCCYFAFVEVRFKLLEWTEMEGSVTLTLFIISFSADLLCILNLCTGGVGVSSRRWHDGGKDSPNHNVLVLVLHIPGLHSRLLKHISQINLIKTMFK